MLSLFNGNTAPYIQAHTPVSVVSFEKLVGRRILSNHLLCGLKRPKSSFRISPRWISICNLVKLPDIIDEVESDFQPNV
jgi:hypothetical protein